MDSINNEIFWIHKLSDPVLSHTRERVKHKRYTHFRPIQLPKSSAFDLPRPTSQTPSVSFVSPTQNKKGIFKKLCRVRFVIFLGNLVFSPCSQQAAVHRRLGMVVVVAASLILLILGLELESWVEEEEARPALVAWAVGVHLCW